MYICQDVCRNTYTENMTLLFSVKMLGARDGHTIDVIFIVSLEEYFVSFILHMAPLYYVYWGLLRFTCKHCLHRLLYGG